MESFLRKYFWTVDLAAAALCGVFLARGTASLIEANLVANTPPHKPPPPTYHSSAGKDKGIEPVLRRNVFCSSCPPIELGDPVEARAVSASGAGSAGPSGEPQRTSLPIALISIMYAPPPAGIRYSVAVIRDNDTRGAGAYGVGDSVREAKVIGIEETRVHFDNKGRPEYLDLLDTPEPPPRAVAVEGGEDGPRAPTDELGEELERGLKQLGEHTYELQRATLDSVLGNMALLSRSARIVPELREGKAAGFRLYSVRPDGPFAKIGMQNGDVIYAINGLEMSSPEKALEVYSKLKAARHLSVSLERNGERVTKEYTIR